jgi:uncharacterized OB-fold protein
MAEPIAPSEQDAPFWEGARRGQLMVQSCGGCERLRFPPRTMCPWCHSFETNWRAMSGRGTIWSFVAPHSPLTPDFERLAPYNVIVVALDEDPNIRMVGNLVASKDGAINEIDPARIRIGAKVEVVFQQAGGIVMPRWMHV